MISRIKIFFWTILLLQIRAYTLLNGMQLTNILLTEDMEPKLSDFGLAKMIGFDETKVFSEVRGTIGYMDPEYMTNAQLTCASDIYSFGIVILQLLSGRKVIELDIDARDILTKKAKDVAQRKRPLEDFVDHRLEKDVNLADFNSILQIADLCVASSSQGRPSSEDLFYELDRIWTNTLANMPPRERSARKSFSTLEAFELGMWSNEVRAHALPSPPLHLTGRRPPRQRRGSDGYISFTATPKQVVKSSNRQSNEEEERGREGATSARRPPAGICRRILAIARQSSDSDNAV
ncbi:hypothetical protein Taro_013701 [Colocasia esculenta]|uniref:Protein kinase domain-containing protein n=1 Tax=Colocasia esculenta TaxID=4460 RepID=A0A843UGV6_COLES|nr:hypothetical protein [Colocasia esculenta]